MSSDPHTDDMIFSVSEDSLTFLFNSVGDSVTHPVVIRNLSSDHIMVDISLPPLTCFRLLNDLHLLLQPKQEHTIYIMFQSERLTSVAGIMTFSSQEQNVTVPCQAIPIFSGLAPPPVISFGEVNTSEIKSLQFRFASQRTYSYQFTINSSNLHQSVKVIPQSGTVTAKGLTIDVTLNAPSDSLPKNLGRFFIQGKYIRTLVCVCECIPIGELQEERPNEKHISSLKGISDKLLSKRNQRSSAKSSHSSQHRKRIHPNQNVKRPILPELTPVPLDKNRSQHPSVNLDSMMQQDVLDTESTCSVEDMQKFLREEEMKSQQHLIAKIQELQRILPSLPSLRQKESVEYIRRHYLGSYIPLLPLVIPPRPLRRPPASFIARSHRSLRPIAPTIPRPLPSPQVLPKARGVPPFQARHRLGVYFPYSQPSNRIRLIFNAFGATTMHTRRDVASLPPTLLIPDAISWRSHPNQTHPPPFSHLAFSFRTSPQLFRPYSAIRALNRWHFRLVPHFMVKQK